MVVCFLCKKKIDIKALRGHFNFIHSDHEFVEYLCYEDQCARSFHLYNSYKRHLEKCHLSSECNPKKAINTNTTRDINVVCSLDSAENTGCSYKDGPTKQILVSEIDYIYSHLTLDRSKPLIKVTWATMCSIRYNKGCVLVYDIDKDGYLYMFLVVENVYVYNSEELFFSGKVLETIDFDDHYFAYHVKPADECRTVFYNSLLSPITNALCMLFNGEQYVILRSPL